MPKLIIYTDGVFDLCHYGHYRVFEQIKEHFGDCYLIVGVATDEDCKKYKKSPILTCEERKKCIKYNKFVDEIVDHAPWIITKEFMDTYKIDYYAHHESSCDLNDSYPKSVKKFFPIKYTQGISTTEIINRILLKYK
jgi:choline-phosphate cytidylyltransferase